ncbi:hypothetical protein RUND412_010797 [Rhizina undulata]
MSSESRLNPSQQPDIELRTVRFGMTPMSFDRLVSEINATDALLDTLRDSIATIAVSHDANLASYDFGSIPTETEKLQNALDKAFSVAERFRDVLMALEEDMLWTELAMDLEASEKKKGMVERARGGIRDAMQEWKKMESIYRKKFIIQMKTEVLIAMPGASEEEIARIIHRRESNIFYRALKWIAMAKPSSIRSSIRARNAELDDVETSLKEISLMLHEIEEKVDMDTIVARGPRANVLNPLGGNQGGGRYNSGVSGGATTVLFRAAMRRKLVVYGLLGALPILIAASVWAAVIATRDRRGV